MMQTKVFKGYIIGQRLLSKGEVMFYIFKRVIALFIAVVIIYMIVSSFWGVVSDTTTFILMGLGILLVVIGILSNVMRSSPIKVGTINRAEFYRVVVALVGYIMYVNTRIDQIMIKLMGG